MEIGKAVKEVVEYNRRRGGSSRRWKNMVDDQRGVRTYSLKDKRKKKKKAACEGERIGERRKCSP